MNCPTLLRVVYSVIRQCIPILLCGIAAQSCSTLQQHASAHTESSGTVSSDNAAKARRIMREAGLHFSSDTTKAYSYDPPGSLVTTNKQIELPKRRVILFSKAGVGFSTDFDGARLNDVVMLNDSTFRATVAPENAPINFSAWYAFKVWSTIPSKIIRLTLTYTEAHHRYIPKLSRTPSADWRSWRPIDSTSYIPHYDSTGRTITSATLRLALTPDTLWVSAQELFTSRDFEVWSTRLAALPFVQKTVLGKSALGKPIIRLDISEARPDAPCVVVISRQHPPEHTGTLALLPFVEEFTSQTPLAQEFRKKFRVFVVPCVNPDGVDAGHWRHNAHGVDLNRDWYNFNQPETRLVRDALLHMRDSLKTRFVFGVDFHTTQHDIFYTLSNPPLVTAQDSIAYATIPEYSTYNTEAAQRSAFVEQWLERLQELFPTYQVTISDSPRTPHGATSGRWFDRELRAPAVTYEAGDETPRELIQSIGAASARILMQMLLDREKTINRSQE
ncbi:MAG: M14 family metallopeptidase [Bacteroidota bacterium]|nr:M14 family metallopeptidase [Candidatus Kapabacteria bacterium]MDW8219312.1 M14 family metallopeptidase [Bacteroidota bacterium]